MREYKYTAKDGETLGGTLEEIGDALIDMWGDQATQDNPEPWLDLDKDGAEAPRKFTLDEWIEWASRAEDRPVKHVRRSLVALGGIRPLELRCRREALGLSQVTLAEVLGVTQATVSRWEAGKQPIPHGVKGEVADLEDQLDRMATLMVAVAGKVIDEGETPALRVHVSDQAFWAAHPDSDGVPAVIQRVAAARAAREVQRLRGVSVDIIAA